MSYMHFLNRHVAEAANKPREQVLQEIGDYVGELLAALEG